MDVPISLGVSLALGLSRVRDRDPCHTRLFRFGDHALFFLLCGRYLDLAMRRKTRVFAGNLASIKAEFAHRLDASGELTQVPVALCIPAIACWCAPANAFPPTAP